MSDLSRRDFVLNLIMAASGLALAGSCKKKPSVTLFPDDLGEPTSTKIRMAVIGLGGFGLEHVTRLKRRRDVQLVYLCDADRDRCDAALDKHFDDDPHPPKVVQDMRRIFDDPGVDAVSIALPHHWHALAAIWAMQAGKDVYLEKPASHALAEGRRIVEAARKYQRVCQVGTHRRSNTALQAARDLVARGRLGDVTLAHCLAFRRRRGIGARGTYEPPASLDYNLWCGPAPLAPLTRKKLHYDWHWFWETGNGAIGNNGIHRVDVARWVMGLTGLGTHALSYGGRFGEPDAGETPNTQVAIHKYGDRCIVQQVRGLDAGAYRGHRDGVIWRGVDADMVYVGNGVTIFDKKGTAIEQVAGRQTNHFHSFLTAVQSRKQTDVTCDIEDGHASSGLCHLANASYRLGARATVDEVRRELERIPCADDVADTLRLTTAHIGANGVELAATPLWLGRWLELDAAGDGVVGCPEAAPVLARTYRPPFVLPALTDL